MISKIKDLLKQDTQITDILNEISKNPTIQYIKFKKYMSILLINGLFY